MTGPIGENERIFREVVYEIRKAKKAGKVRKDCEELAPLFAELFAAMANETKACGDSVEPAIAMLREVIEAFDEPKEAGNGGAVTP